MNISAGIVGLPNVGVVAVPDERLEKLAEEKEKGYSFLIKKADGAFKLKDIELNKYLNRWGDIK